MKPLVVLGATGSIGRQALAVADHLGLSVVGLAAGHLSGTFAELATEYPDAHLAVATAEEYDAGARGAGARGETRPTLGDIGNSVTGRLQVGADAVADLAGRFGDVVVVNGIVGAAGLGPSVAALEAGNRLALANKETMVAGGPLVAAAAARGGGDLVPVDSEHSALWQCLVGERPEHVARLVLTASGGPFRGLRTRDLAAITPGQALAHPTWDMGPRITIDSATLMNKALEVIEAHHLFGIDYDRIDVVVHPQSVVHSMVEFVDGSIKAQIGDPDMRVPIQYAITAPDRRPGLSPPMSLAGHTLVFEEPDRASFPCLDLGYRAGRRGGVVPAVLNAADEVAVAAFLAGEIRFPAIAEVVASVVEGTSDAEPSSVDDVLAADGDARTRTRQLIASLG